MVSCPILESLDGSYQLSLMIHILLMGLMELLFGVLHVFNMSSKLRKASESPLSKHCSNALYADLMQPCSILGSFFLRILQILFYIWLNNYLGCVKYLFCFTICSKGEVKLIALILIDFIGHFRGICILIKIIQFFSKLNSRFFIL